MRAAIVTFVLVASATGRAQTPPPPTAPLRPAVGDPVSNAKGPAPQSLAPPLLDQLSAALAVTPADARVTVSLAPFGFTKHHYPLLSELRIEAFTAAASNPQFGFSVSVGLNRAAFRMNDPIGKEAAQKIVASCAKPDAGAVDVEVAALRLGDPIRSMLDAFEAADTANPGFAKAPYPVQAPNRAVVLAQIEPLATADPQRQYDWANRVGTIAGQVLSLADDYVTAYHDKAKAPPPASFTSAQITLKVMTDYWARVANTYDKTKVEACVDKAFQKYAVDRAFQNAVAVYLKGSVALFPPGFGPKFTSSGSVVDPFNNELSNGSIAMNLFFFPDRYSRFLASLAFSESSNSSSSTSLDKKLAGGVDLAWSRPFGEADSDGYTASWGLGISGNFEKCFETKGCTRTDVVGYGSVKSGLAVDWFASGSIYAFVRLKPKLEFQLAIPFNTYVLNHAIDMTDSRTTVFEVVPTLTASVASWTIGQAAVPQ